MVFDIFDRKYMVDLEHKDLEDYKELQMELFRVGFFWLGLSTHVSEFLPCALYLNDRSEEGRLMIRSARDSDFYAEVESGEYTELSYDFLIQKLSELPSKNTGQPD